VPTYSQILAFREPEEADAHFYRQQEIQAEEAEVSAVPLVVDAMCPPAGDLDHERQLVERAKTDREALSSLYRRYQPRITSYVMRRVGRTHDAEDVVANVFLAMVRGLGRYRCGQAPFVAWLYRIAINEINRSLRKRCIRRFFGGAIEVVDRGQPPDDAEQLRRALAELPFHYQAVLSLHYLEDLSVDEIALVVGVPPGTVKSRLSRGRDLLKAKLLARIGKEAATK
jgi:RNA polymerase sigma-70 factor (ECF subfamily)